VKIVNKIMPESCFECGNWWRDSLDRAERCKVDIHFLHFDPNFDQNKHLTSAKCSLIKTNNEGCDFCNEKHELVVDMSNIHYCPNCGRKLN